MSEPTDSDAVATAERKGDPLAGLWHWTDHPAARVGIVIAILFGTVFVFILFAQVGWF